MKKTLRITTILSALLLVIPGCVSKRNSFPHTSYEIVNNYRLKPKVYKTKNFTIFTLQRLYDPKKPLRIYIEGDGRAYIDKYTPSFNPTPVSEFLLDIISHDNSPNIVYIARPCQYIDSKNCQEKYWTSARFSPEVIESMNEVVNKFSNYQLELIGYSGGAMIINHLDAKNIKNIRTIAGNLDIKEFTKIHQISNLNESDVDYNKLADIPQIHFIGKQDKTIPPDIFYSYKKHFLKRDCLKAVGVKYATHYSGWDSQWHNLLQIKLPMCKFSLKASSVALNSKPSQNKTF